MGLINCIVNWVNTQYTENPVNTPQRSKLVSKKDAAKTIGNYPKTTSVQYRQNED